MIKKNLLFALVTLISLSLFSQKGQRIAFVDMNYILENIPAYTRAQTQLNKKVQIWQQDLDKIQGEITTMQTDLSNEKALLTDDLIAEKEEDIIIKQLEFKKAEESYFSSNGNLFLLRKQLVTPIQDQVYNAAQEIAKARRYDYVFDKSSDLIMLYSNKSNDISELVLRSIVRGEKATKAEKKRVEANRRPAKTTVVASQKAQTNGTTAKPQSNQVDEIDGTSSETAVVDTREAKRAAALAKIEEQKVARAKKRQEQKAAIEKKRLERLKQREDVRKELENNKDKKSDSKDEKEDDQKENNN